MSAREGQPIPFTPKLVETKREPYPTVVEHLEALLVQAKKGELMGIAYAMVLSDGVQIDHGTNSGYAVAPGTQWGMSHAIGNLNRRWGEECDR